MVVAVVDDGGGKGAGFVVEGGGVLDGGGETVGGVVHAAEGEEEGVEDC